MDCEREFPQLVQLHREHSDNVACVSLNIDYDGSPNSPPESYRKSVLEFLTKYEAEFQNVVCADSSEVLYDKLDLGSIPAVLVYNQQGELSKRFDNDQQEYGSEGFTYQKHVIPFVEGLLGE
jgi:hypothetical protein